MNYPPLTKIKRKGEGVYGIVYSAEESQSLEGRTSYAVKRNLVDRDADFMGSIRELDILIKLNGHPHIVATNSITFGDPFADGNGSCMSPVEDELYKDDKVHFVFEEAQEDGASYFLRANWIDLKEQMSHILLATEYFHSKGIIHRDLKPANILYYGGPHKGSLRVCDFGLSKPVTLQGFQTPSIVTSWYRAPEILFNEPYDTKVDLWSVGCIFYETVSKVPLLNGSPDRSDKILTSLARYFPELRMKGGRLSRLTSSWQKQIERKIPPEDKETFISLLEGLLKVNPEERFSAREALEHPFFDPYRQYITTIRDLFPPVADEEKAIRIKECTTRDKAMIIARNIFRGRSKFKWYRHRILFQAISLFDRYLASGEKVPPGKIRLSFLLCLYLSIKYFMTLTALIPFSSIYGEITGKDKKYAEEMEKKLIDVILDCNVYEPTIYEAADSMKKYLEEEEVSRLLDIYSRGEINGTKLNGMKPSQAIQLYFTT